MEKASWSLFQLFPSSTTAPTGLNKYKTLNMKKLLKNKNDHYYVYLLVSWSLVLLPLNYLLAINNTSDWLSFKKEAPLTVSQLLKQKNTLLGLTQKDTFHLQKIIKDDLGFTHYRFQQNHQQIPIEGAHFIVHEQASRIQNVNGHLIKGLAIEVQPSLSEATALQFALAHVGANTYAWENAQYELALQSFQESTATFYPIGQLVIAPYQIGTKQADDYRLAYKFDVYAIEPLSRQWIYVDAHTGGILSTLTQLKDQDVVGTGQKQYGCAEQVAFTCHQGCTAYQLKEHRRGGSEEGIATYTANHTNAYPGFVVSSTESYFADSTAVAVHWGTEQVYDYYHHVHKRNSFDNKGSVLKSWVHYGENFNNAFWNGTWMTYGDGDGSRFTALTSLDIIAHEITHAITDYSAGLVYYNEPGALNESFSDIFGVLLSFYAEGEECANWVIGEAITPNGQGIRDLKNPNKFQHPDTYQGDYWYDGNGDNGGVHINSGVHNHWFYLLAKGGSGVNDKGYHYEVNSIGRDKAAQIAYRNLTVYLLPTSDYVDAYHGSIQSATDLYGADSEEVKQTKAAWCAVGLGACSSEQSNTLTLLSPTSQDVLRQRTGTDVFEITWAARGAVGAIQIDYSLNNGATWTTLEQVAAGSRSYRWLVPDVNSDVALVRLTDVTDVTIRDKNRTPFRIDGCGLKADFEVLDSVICIGETISFINHSIVDTVQNEGANHYSYQWKINDVVYSNEVDFSHAFTEGGTYMVQLTIAKTGSDCIDEYTECLQVASPLTAEFDYVMDSLTIDFKPTFTTAKDYTWQFENSTTSTTIAPTHTFSSFGHHEVCLTVETDCGRIDTCQTINLVDTSTVTCGGEEQWQQFLNRNAIRDVQVVDDVLWVASASGGLVKIDLSTEENTIFSNANSDLPFNNVNDVYVTQEDRVWVGTADGLATFDGQSTTDWTVYKMANSELPDNYILSVFLSSSGMVYTGTLNGLARFNPQDETSWEKYDLTTFGLESNIITKIYQSQSGAIYVGTTKGLIKFPNEQQINMERSTIYLESLTGLPNDHIEDILEHNGNIFVATRGGIGKFNEAIDAIWVVFDENTSSLPNNEVRALSIDSQNKIWMATNGGIAQFDGTTPYGNWIFYNSDSGLKSNDVQAITIGTADQPFIGMTSHGIMKFDGNSWNDCLIEDAVIPNSLVSKMVYSHDSTHIFMATLFEGLVKFNVEQPINTIFFNTLNSDMPNDKVFDVMVDDDGQVWVATDGGLASFNGTDATNWERYYDVAFGSTHHSVLQHSNGNIYVGTKTEGLRSFDGTNWHEHTNNNLNDIYSILEDNDGNILVGQQGALSIFNVNDRSWTTPPNSYPYSLAFLVSSIVQTDDGAIFTASHGTVGSGLVKYDGQGWVHYTMNNSDLPQDNIFSLVEDQAGDIYMATFNGLAKFNGIDSTGWTVYKADNSGLSNNGVTSLLLDKKEQLIVTTGGIAQGEINILSDQPLTTAFFNSPNQLYSNIALSFTNISGITDAASYEWKVDGLAVSTDDDLIYTFPKSGHYIVTLQVTDASDCTTSYSQRVMIEPTASDLDLGEDLVVCANSVLLQPNIPNLTSYTWSFNQTVVSTSTSYTATTSGEYELEVTDIFGNQHTDVIQVEFNNDCVWAGDYNYDNIVNNRDLLALGMSFGITGIERPHANLVWAGQAGPNWRGNYLPNYKHIDGDGNGAIDLQDQLAIAQNYHQQRGPVIPIISSPNPIKLSPVMMQEPQVTDSTATMRIDMELIQEEDTDHTASLAAYGLAFEIFYEVEEGLTVKDAQFNFTNSWLGNENVDLLTTQRHFPIDDYSGKVEVAMTRINHQNITHYGCIGGTEIETDFVPSADSLKQVYVEISKIELTVSSSRSSVDEDGQYGISMYLEESEDTFAFSLREEPTVNSRLALTAFLAAPYEETTRKMQTTLRDQCLLPKVQPFSGAPWFYDGLEAVPSPSDLPLDMVDWVLVEVQDEKQRLVFRRALALLSDGRVVDIAATGIFAGDVWLTALEQNKAYTFILRHRNHVDVATANTYRLDELNTITVDFSDPHQVLGQFRQLILLDEGQNIYGLVPGDATGDGIINVHDFNAFRAQQGEEFTYDNSDFGIDGHVLIDDFNWYQTFSSHIGVAAIRL